MLKLMLLWVIFIIVALAAGNIPKQQGNPGRIDHEFGTFEDRICYSYYDCRDAGSEIDKETQEYRHWQTHSNASLSKQLTTFNPSLPSSCEIRSRNVSYGRPPSDHFMKPEYFLRYTSPRQYPEFRWDVYPHLTVNGAPRWILEPSLRTDGMFRLANEYYEGYLGAFVPWITNNGPIPFSFPIMSTEYTEVDYYYLWKTEEVLEDGFMLLKHNATDSFLVVDECRNEYGYTQRLILVKSLDTIRPVMAQWRFICTEELK